MTETLIEIGDELLGEAATILGTSSIKDAVQRCFEESFGGAQRASSRPPPATGRTTPSRADEGLMAVTAAGCATRAAQARLQVAVPPVDKPVGHPLYGSLIPSATSD